MDVKGDQFMVNGQRLRFTMNPTLFPFITLMPSPWKKSPNVWPRTKNKAWISVNSFSFNFLEFLVKIYWANFSHVLRKRKKGGTRETEPDRPPEQGGSAGPVRSAQVGPGGVSPRFFPGLLLFDFLLRSEILREV
jgi:hypothetical protein